MGTSSKPKSRNQIVKWLRHPHSDAAEYKMWGNGVAFISHIAQRTICVSTTGRSTCFMVILLSLCWRFPNGTTTLRTNSSGRKLRNADSTQNGKKASALLYFPFEDLQAEFLPILLRVRHVLLILFSQAVAARLESSGEGGLFVRKENPAFFIAAGKPPDG